MKTKTFLTLLSILCLLASCAKMDPHPMDMTQAVQSATTRADHNALAKHYEDTAKEMQSKVQEHKKQLEEYENHSYNYGKRAQDLQGHCKGLIHYYGQAAEANSKMAEIHRQLAAEIK
ncbi:MAG: hypothetical protein DID90_2727553712 [Candidatus Nitrotoga sp. LAW]|nr:MAG: hypothetical protein DID90_2727553712 [Candidatus Nitrotoga sp. LAW]